jgi:uncharacterized protein YdiU (UPF0061 family)
MSDWQHIQMNHRYASLPSHFYTKVSPMPLDNMRWGIWNSPFALSFGFPQTPNSALLDAFAEGRLKKDFAPLAMKYAGHQFGVYNPDLGDGRGLLLGEVANDQGRWFEIHIKGSGQTPYSRMGDGRAVLRSTIREYLCSEAIAALGGQTTRALGLVVSDTPVYREQVEQGALLIRMAETHIRFGHFEHFYYTDQLDSLTLLADKVIEWFFPEAMMHDQPYLFLFEQIIERTAEMIAFWQGYGFAHGVMNTDNMSILGQTFDFGPFAFLDDYDPQFICNHSDHQGRYAFNMQPGIGLWNLTALAQALTPLVDKNKLEVALTTYPTKLNRAYGQLIRQKLGWQQTSDADNTLCAELFDLMEQNRVDYTWFFRRLSSLDEQPLTWVAELFQDQTAALSWLAQYHQRCAADVDDSGNPIPVSQRCRQMRQVNPKYVLRNYLAQQAIEAAEQGDFTELHQLTDVLRRPFDEQSQYERFAALPPAWGKCLEISCSS